MFLKISRGVWFVSVAGILASLLLVYASLPEQVFLMQQGLEYVSLSREAFFYLALGLFTLVNSMVYIIRSLFAKDEAFRGWFHLLIVTLNIFFAVTLFFLNAYNSTERFNFEKIGFMIYGSVLLVSVCALFWPAYAILRKILNKPAV